MNKSEGFESVESNIEADLAFLADMKDTDKVEVLVTIPGGEIPAGSGYEVEAMMTQDDDHNVWEDRSIREVRALVLECQRSSKIKQDSDYPLAFKDPKTGEEHSSAYAKLYK